MENNTMNFDLYEMRMAYAYFKSNFRNTKVCFDMFYRSVPDKGGYVIAAGIEQFMEYMNNIKFDEGDINYFRNKNIGDEEFYDYLRNFKFTGSISGVPEGTLVYPNTPIITVYDTNIVEAQLIETMMLLTINHQSLIATKASRIKRAAGDKVVMEFGARRAHGDNAAVYGARAAYIGGVDATANPLAEQMFGMNATGTMAHSFIQFFEDEFEAFKHFALTYPDECSLLIDTYNTLKSGIKNAVRVEKEVLRPIGKHVKSVRIDSGDLAYLTKEVRKILDSEGMTDCKIIVSNSLDEWTIHSLLKVQNAPIDSFGVGERLITSKSSPVMGGVYKLCAVKNEDGTYSPRIKMSNDAVKITNPGFKTLWRLYDRDTKLTIADVLTLYDEGINSDEPYKLFHPLTPWKVKFVDNFIAIKLHVDYFINGEDVYSYPSMEEIRDYVHKQLYDWTYCEELRFENPHEHMVSLSQKLYDLKMKMLEEHNG